MGILQFFWITALLIVGSDLHGATPTTFDFWFVDVPAGYTVYDVHFVYDVPPVSASIRWKDWTATVSVPPPPAPPAAEFKTSTAPIKGGQKCVGPFVVERPINAHRRAYYFTSKSGSALLISNNGCIPLDFADGITAFEGCRTEYYFTAHDPELVTQLKWSATDLPPFVTLNSLTGCLTLAPAIGDAGEYTLVVTVSDDGPVPMGAGLQTTLTVCKPVRIAAATVVDPLVRLEVDPGPFAERVDAGTCTVQLERSEDFNIWSGPILSVRREHERVVFEEPMPLSSGRAQFYRAVIRCAGDVAPPVLTLNRPGRVSSTFDDVVIVSGCVRSGAMPVTVGCQANDLYIQVPVDQNGRFEIAVPLKAVDGVPLYTENNLRISAVDAAGQVAQEDVTVLRVNRYENRVVIVQFLPGTPIEAVLDINAQIGAVIRSAIKPLDLYLMEFVGDKDVSAVMDRYMSFERVMFAEPNYLVVPDSMPPQVVPNDPLFVQQLSFQPAANLVAHWTRAWAITNGTQNTVVAVIDSGVDHTHPDLVNNLWVNQNELPVALRTTGDVDGDGLVTLADANAPGAQAIFANFGITDSNGDGLIDGREFITSPVADGIDSDGNGFVDDLIGYSMTHMPAAGELPNNDPMDCQGLCLSQGHGTAVAGIIAAVGNNATGVCGANWRAQLMALRVENRATGLFDVWAITRAIVYAAQHGARIANNSFSLYAAVPPLAWVGPNGAYLFAESKGMFVAASASNMGWDNDVTPHWPGNFSLGMAGFVQVAAHNPNGLLAQLPGDLFNSSFGVNTVNLAAPGTANAVYSTRVSWQVTSPGLNPNLWAIGYGPFFGTSAATAHVSGLGGLLLSVNPNLVGPAVKRCILSAARPRRDYVPIPVQKSAILNAPLAVALAQQTLKPGFIVTSLGTSPNVSAEARVFDSQFNQQTTFYPFGFPVAGGVDVATGDINGDGSDDLVFLINSQWVPLQLRVTDRQGTVIAELDLASPTGLWTITTADLDADGDDEILLMVPWTLPDGTTGNLITAYRYDGTAPVQDRLVFHSSWQQSFPTDSTLAAGDVDGDGLDEIVVGIPQTSSTGPTPLIQPARAEIYRITPGPGFPLTLLGTCHAGVPVWAEALEVAVVDINGDGASEIVTVPSVGSGDAAKVFNYNGSLLGMFGHYAGNTSHGLRPRVAGGDIDCDGIDEVIIGQALPTVDVVKWSPFFGAPRAVSVSRVFMPYGVSLATSVRVAVFH